MSVFRGKISNEQSEQRFCSHRKIKCPETSIAELASRNYRCRPRALTSSAYYTSNSVGRLESLRKAILRHNSPVIFQITALQTVDGCQVLGGK